MLTLSNSGTSTATFTLQALRYGDDSTRLWAVPAGATQTVRVPVAPDHRWYDHVLRVKELTGFGRRLAGHLENGEPSVSDPAMGGTAVLDQFRI